MARQALRSIQTAARFAFCCPSYLAKSEDRSVVMTGRPFSCLTTPPHQKSKMDFCSNSLIFMDFPT